MNTSIYDQLMKCKSGNLSSDRVECGNQDCVWSIVNNDFNLFLDVPLSFVDKMLKENREGNERDYLNGKADIHEASIDFQSNVRKFYIAQTESDKNFIRINCSDSKGEMLPTEEIFKKISPLLPIKRPINLK